MSSNFHKIFPCDVCQSKTGHMLSRIKNIENNGKKSVVQPIFNHFGPILGGFSWSTLPNEVQFVQKLCTCVVVFSVAAKVPRN